MTTTPSIETPTEAFDNFLSERSLSSGLLSGHFGVELTEDGTEIRIPLRSSSGKLLGNLYRSLDSNSYRADKGLRTNDVIYNESIRAVPTTKTEKRLWVVEGVADVWALAELGIYCAVALMGGYASAVSRRKLEHIAALASANDLELVLWIEAPYDAGASDASYRGLAPLFEQLHRMHPNLKTAAFDANLETEYNGSPASLLSRMDREELGDALLRGPQLDGTTAQIVGTLYTLQEARIALRARAVQDALQRAPQRPDLERLSRLMRDQDPELWFDLDARPEELEQWLAVSLSPQAGGPVADKLREWVAERGSDVLKYALERGYDIVPMALNERAAEDLAPGSYVDALPRSERTLAVGARNHPTRPALETEMRLIESGHKANDLQVCWISTAPEGCPQGEVIEVRNYLGRYTAYVPV